MTRYIEEAEKTLIECDFRDVIFLYETENQLVFKATDSSNDRVYVEFDYDGDFKNVRVNIKNNEASEYR